MMRVESNRAVVAATTNSGRPAKTLTTCLTGSGPTDTEPSVKFISYLELGYT